jgi:acyl-CoA thioester hydrolase
MPHTKRIEIRWRDMDAFGHVNNSVYLTYLEEGRDEYLTLLLGATVQQMVIRHVEVDFAHEVSQDDDAVDVEVSLTRVGSSSFATAERVTRAGDGRLVATAATVMVHLDESRSASAPLPDEVRATLEGEL